MKKFYTFALLVPVALFVNAHQLSPSEALARIPAATVSDKSMVKTLSSSQPVMTVSAPGNTSFTSLYVFDSGASGYMIVSADDCAAPLLGYSDKGGFDAENMPPQLKWWLNYYASQIESASNGSEYVEVKADYASIAPMLSTQWNQSAPYNDRCPVDNGSRSVTGCVATAMAQAMKFHNWPEKGKGSNSYSWNNQTLSLDFSTITFDWTDMTDTYDSNSTDKAKDAVAELMYACGVSVDMNYTASESGASSAKIAPALYNYFDYSDAMGYVQRNFYNDKDWNAMVYEQLAQGMPVLYCGDSDEGGHQFVCDGYSADGYFHFNWGWAGMSDGYYLLSALDPESQGIGGSTTGYNDNQGIIINMQPSSKTAVKAQPLIYCYGGFSAKDNGADLGTRVIFSSSEAFYNFGCKEVKGFFGIKIVAADSTATYADSESVFSLKPLKGYSTFSVTLPDTLADGKYKVTPAFKAEDSDEWADVLAPLSANQSLIMTVSDGYATFADGKSGKLQVSDFNLATDIYLGSNFKATFTLTNVGSKEYYGELMFALLDDNGNIVDQTSDAEPVDIMAGETSDIAFIGQFATEMESENGQTTTVEPGTYTLVIFEYLTGSVVYEYGQQVDVKGAPSDTRLQVGQFGLADGSTVVTDASKVEFAGTVQCVNGFYGNQLKVAVFPQGATSTSIEGSTDFLFLSEGDSASFTASADITGAEAGDSYFAIVYDAQNNEISNAITFTIAEDGIEAATVETTNARYYNLQGIEISSDNLTPGIYIMHNGTQAHAIRL